jgi:hypothetical protein
MIGDAQIVGLGESTHGAREEVTRQRPDAFYMTGGWLTQWFDVIVHRQVVTPWRPL